MTAEEVRALLREQVAQAGTAKAWAEQHRVNLTVLSETMRGRRDPAGAISRALGLRREYVYHRVEA